MRACTFLLLLAAIPAAAAPPAPPPPAAPKVPPPALPVIDVTSTRVELDQSPSLSTDIVFEVGEATIKKDAQPLLDAIAKAIVKEAQSKIVIDVYTDDTAPDNDRSGVYLQKLSQQRADALSKYFQKRGVPARRLVARGRGMENPQRDNSSDDGRRANRRIEMSVESDIRPPVAADLATYTKTLRGTGTKIVATIDTTKGALHCELFADKTPATVANFIGLATGQKPWTDPKTGKIVKGKPFYDGLVFHRVIPGFMIQGGDPLGVGTGGPGYTFADELSPDLVNKPGSLAMANAGPSTNGSQFFIDEVRSPHLDNRHTVFGQCKEVEIVTAIANVPRGPNDKPSTPVTIRKITFVKQP
ncbi:MAG TPA: peptidylprolyl isomerase [Kofleriaceae bacterium]|nr:peptidylprolyl isomerase [Kofleriaceae bacterium]